jgi:hypothetical protein
MKTLKPGSFGHQGLIGKKVVAKEANRVSAKCAIHLRQLAKKVRTYLLLLLFFKCVFGRFSARGVRKHGNSF